MLNKDRFKDDPVEDLVAWRDALLADGWATNYIYAKAEAVLNLERSICFEKDGFSVHIYRTTDSCSNKIHAWGPIADVTVQAAIQIPDTVDIAQLKANVDLCDQCGQHGPTQLVGFANRVCRNCFPKAVKEIERPGWTN